MSGTVRGGSPGFKGKKRRISEKDTAPSRFLSYTVKKLQRIADEMGVELPKGKVRKAEIVEAIENHQPEAS